MILPAVIDKKPADNWIMLDCENALSANRAHLRPFSMSVLIRNRFFLLLLRSCLFASFSTAGSIYCIGTHTLRQNLGGQLQRNAATIGQNVRSGLLSGNMALIHKAIRETAVSPRVHFLRLEDRTGRIVSQAGSPMPPNQQQNGHLLVVWLERLFPPTIEVQQTIISHNATLGRITLRADARRLDLPGQQLFGTILSATLSSLLAAMLSGRTIQRLYVARIDRLREVARRVTSQKSYSIRAEVSGADEVARLAEDINTVLDQFQRRDEALELELQERVLDQARLNARLTRQAYHDALTQLPNRALFDDRLRQALAHAQRFHHRVAVFLLDFDRFKVINDCLGHAIGDQLLVAIANRLRDCVRQGHTLARFGGDEFTLILPNIDQPRDALPLAQSIVQAFHRPVQCEGHEMQLTASIGICVYPEDGEEPGTLIRNADMAMYQAKERGGNRYQFFSSDLGRRFAERLRLERLLNKALERNEFQLYYQPQINRHHRLVGVEALLRWRQPELGSIPPETFIPIAEETGLILPLGEWVVIEACRQASRWQRSGMEPLRVSVNLSPRQFHLPDLARFVDEKLRETGLEPHNLGLEITETGIMEDRIGTIRTLKTLDEMGVYLSIDDFGTGYSSLGYLKRFPIDALKIDRSFVRDIQVNRDDSVLTAAIIYLAHSLNVEVVAEGVETVEQHRILSEYGCDYVQGFLFGKPMEADKLEAFARSYRPPPGNPHLATA